MLMPPQFLTQMLDLFANHTILISLSEITLIYNPKAGRLQRRPELIEKAAGWLAPLGAVRMTPTTGPNTAGALAAEAAANGAKTVIAFGGDGTVNEVANGLIGTGVTLGIIPGGTANVICVETGLGTNPEKAARRLVEECDPVRIAVGRIDRPDGFSRHFLAMAGVGIDAIVVEEVNPAIKKRLGKFAYWVAGFSLAFRRLPQLEYDIAGQTRRCSFLLASRVRNYGGDLEIARRVSLLEPCFEAMAFHGVYAVRYLPYLAGVLGGFAAKMPGVDASPAMSVAARPAHGEHVPIQVDGELAGQLPAEFRVVPDALTLLIPRAYVARSRRRPWIT